MQKTIVTTVLASAVALLACGCAEKLTYSRFETVSDGDSPEAVEATLGKPWQRTDQAWIYFDEDRGITASVYFDEAKVIGKEWADAEHGMQGKSPRVNQPGESHEIRAKEIK